MENTVQTTSHHYAGFWIRFLAMLIDGVILGIISRILFGNQVTEINGTSVSVGFTGVYNLIPIIYTLGFWIWLSATPGKLVLKLKIVQENGEKLNIKSAIIRYIGYFISTIVIFIGFIWAGFDSKKQGWHDKIAKTYVIHNK